jgi:predicted  nucleic acid-binding Zn-ribbon protein
MYLSILTTLAFTPALSFADQGELNTQQVQILQRLDQETSYQTALFLQKLSKVQQVLDEVKRTLKSSEEKVKQEALRRLTIEVESLEKNLPKPLESVTELRNRLQKARAELKHAQQQIQDSARQVQAMAEEVEGMVKLIGDPLKLVREFTKELVATYVGTEKKVGLR